MQRKLIPSAVVLVLVLVQCPQKTAALDLQTGLGYLKDLWHNWLDPLPSGGATTKAPVKPVPVTQPAQVTTTRTAARPTAPPPPKPASPPPVPTWQPPPNWNPGGGGWQPSTGGGFQPGGQAGGWQQPSSPWQQPFWGGGWHPQQPWQQIASRWVQPPPWRQGAQVQPRQG